MNILDGSLIFVEYTPGLVKNTQTYSDCQTNTKNICTKFNDKIFKGSQEIEEPKSNWASKRPQNGPNYMGTHH